MSSHFFLFSGKITQERLSWIEESLKYYFVKLYPESLRYHPKGEETVFTFFVTGSGLYSLIEPEMQPVWEIILSLPSVTIVCDRQELELCGLSVERLKMKYPGQLIDNNRPGSGGKPSFWNDVARLARQTEQPTPGTIGYLQLESPYMHRSALYALASLSAAVDVHASVDLYAYLDGVHLGHISQNPTEFENIGKGLEELCERAAKNGLQCQMVACARCAMARGYSTWDNGEGAVISTCTIKPFKIRDLSVVVDHFKRNHIILAKNSGTIQIRKDTASVGLGRMDKTGHYPPIIILITKSPYGTGMAFGALSFAVACAYQGIPTRVIFIEDGVYALTGSQMIEPDAKLFNIQEVIDVVANSQNLQMYAYIPSLQHRNCVKNRKLNAVLDIGTQELGQILFTLPGGAQADHQRILFF